MLVYRLLNTSPRKKKEKKEKKEEKVEVSPKRDPKVRISKISLQKAEQREKKSKWHMPSCTWETK